MTGAPRNVSDFSDAQVDTWYREQARALDVAKRKEIVVNMQRRMFELVPSAMIAWHVGQVGWWNEVKNYKAGIGLYNNLKFQNVWIAK